MLSLSPLVGEVREENWPPLNFVNLFCYSVLYYSKSLLNFDLWGSGIGYSQGDIYSLSFSSLRESSHQSAICPGNNIIDQVSLELSDLLDSATAASSVL